jgi:hypothetical protein
MSEGFPSCGSSRAGSVGRAIPNASFRSRSFHEPSSGADRDSMNCPRCGLASPAGSRRCDCGWDFEAQRVEGQTPSTPELARRIRRVRGVALLALIVIWGPFLWVLGEGVGPGELLVPAVSLILPFLAPPLLVLAQARGGAAVRPLGSVVSMSATVGLYALLLSLPVASWRPPLWSGRWLWQGSLLLVIATFDRPRRPARRGKREAGAFPLWGSPSFAC